MAAKTTAPKGTDSAEAPTKRTPSRSRKTAKPVATRPFYPKGMKPADRPKTCGALFALAPDVNAAFADEGCARLPRHNGDHRSTKRAPKVKVARKGRAKVTRSPKTPTTLQGLKDLRSTLLADAEAGNITFSDAMSRYAAAESAYRRAKRSAKRTAKPAAEAVA